jgi:hypothetical protein
LLYTVRERARKRAERDREKGQGRERERDRERAGNSERERERERERGERVFSLAAQAWRKIDPRSAQDLPCFGWQDRDGSL